MRRGGGKAKPVMALPPACHRPVARIGDAAAQKEAAPGVGMAVVRITAGEGGPQGLAALAPALAGLPGGAPVAVLVHGYRYAPGHPRDCPHDDILAPEGAASWPRGLGLAGLGGLAVCFGWQARGGLHAAYGRAGAAGQALADLVAHLRTVAPGQRIALMGHSLGARVVLSALAALPAGAADLAILLAPAELAGPGAAALAAPAARGLPVIHVTSAENALFERGFGLLMGAAPIGLAPVRHPGWIDLRLDDPAVLAALARLGHPVGPRAARICHHSSYTRPGALALQGALIAGRLGPGALRDALPAAAPRPPRWRLPGLGGGMGAFSRA